MGDRSHSPPSVPVPAPIHTSIPIFVHYDFASSLCYVAHRVMERIAHRFAPGTAEPGQPPITFHWTPVDLAALLNWKRGAVVPDDRRANAERVARELAVPVAIPRVWLDSRNAMAAALTLGEGDAEAAWRERVYTALFEERRTCDDPDEMQRWARDLGLCFEEAELEGGLAELEKRTRAAAEAMVTGVPTVMLAGWPMGGIQDDDTMVSLISRFARRARERGTA